MAHRLSNLNENTRTADCSVCGPLVGIGKKDVQNGKTRYRCITVQRERAKRRYGRGKISKPWRKHLKDSCETCEFVPVHTIQLEVHHKDGDKKNNDPSNLETLCCNCHALETHRLGQHGSHSLNRLVAPF